MSLEDKLEVILDEHQYVVDNIPEAHMQEFVAQIISAFKDEGWSEPLHREIENDE